MKTNPTFQATCNNTKVQKSLDEIESISLHKTNENQFNLLHKNRNFNFQLLNIDLENSQLELKNGNKTIRIQINSPIQQLIQTLGYHEGKAKHTDALMAPMPGVVLEILTKQNASVLKGDPLIILEAMKMENILRASHDGIIKDILVSKGEKVDKNKILISFI